MTLACFCLSALAEMELIDDVRYEGQKSDWLKWIYAQQVTGTGAGFRGGPYLGNGFDEEGSAIQSNYDNSNLAMTYTALCSLLLLGDDLNRVKANRYK
jgi:geranylgeranyl transferase type-1 subunit beta